MSETAGLGWVNRRPKWLNLLILLHLQIRSKMQFAFHRVRWAINPTIRIHYVRYSSDIGFQ